MYRRPRSREAIRTTPKEWADLNAQIGRLANRWSARIDLISYTGPKGGQGLAAALYDHQTETIEICTTECFGKNARPEDVENFEELETQRDWPQVAGAIMHEAMHAKHTERDWWINGQTRSGQDAEWFIVLEETRIEGRGVQAWPRNREFLRSMALDISLRSLKDEDRLNEMTMTAATARTATLTLARLDAGVLDESDLTEVTVAINRVLPSTLLASLRALWIEFQALDELDMKDQDRGVAIAKEFGDLIRARVKETGEPDANELDLEGLLKALESGKFRAKFGAERSIDDERDAEEGDREAKKRAAEKADENSKKQEAQRAFGMNQSPDVLKTRSKLVQTRKPTEDERGMAYKIAKAMEKAKYRDRTVQKTASYEPPGRLRSRAAMQNRAARINGQTPTSEAWSRKQRRHVDDPNLTVGIMCDISGSMKRAMEPIAVSAWVMAAAAHRIKGRTASLYFGMDIFPGVRPGEQPTDVKVYSAEDGHELFDRGFRALDGGLNLLNGDGARLLVVCSDGQYGAIGQLDLMWKDLSACLAAGVGVLWIAYEETSRTEELAEMGATVVIVNNGVGAAVDAIGRACITALENASVKY